ncbi:MAG: class I SAM-dependent methyltransferase [Methanobacteriaceae archaeon]
MYCIKVLKKNLNEMRNLLIERSILSNDYKIKTEGEFGFIPLSSDINNINNISDIFDISNTLDIPYIASNNSAFNVFEVIEITNPIIDGFKEIKKSPKSIKEQLGDKINQEQLENLKTSFDIIGDTVILEIPEDLISIKELIGEATLKFTGRKSVYMKTSAIEGITRTRQVENIAGEDNPITIHKEHGIRLKLNIKEVYFSPRLASERKRVASQVTDGENILDMFAGIGPFPVIIAKNNNVDVYAVDINETAVEYMKINSSINKLKGKINPLWGNINEIANTIFLPKNVKFDRIIMNLPGSAFEFLPLAMDLISNNGIIHYYQFANTADDPISKINKIAKEKGKVSNIIASRKVKSTKPKEWHFVVDAQITEN